jgi:hypothetical protein
MATQEERKRFIDEFLASPDMAALPGVHKSIYRGQAAELLAGLAMRPIGSFSEKDLDDFLQKKGRSPDAAVAEKVGTALLKYIESRQDTLISQAVRVGTAPPPPEAQAPAPPAGPVPFTTSSGYAAMPAYAQSSPPSSPSKPVGTTTLMGMSLQKGLQYKTRGPRGALIKNTLMAGILSTGRSFMQRGTPLDLSLACLRTIDAYIEKEAPDGQPTATSELGTRRQQVVLEIAAYVSAVIAGAVGGGTIEVDEDDPDAEMNLRLVLPNGQVLTPVMRVIGRLEMGQAQSLAAYGEFAVSRS